MLYLSELQKWSLNVDVTTTIVGKMKPECTVFHYNMHKLSSDKITYCNHYHYSCPHTHNSFDWHMYHKIPAHDNLYCDSCYDNANRYYAQDINEHYFGHQDAPRYNIPRRNCTRCFHIFANITEFVDHVMNLKCIIFRCQGKDELDCIAYKPSAFIGSLCYYGRYRILWELNSMTPELNIISQYYCGWNDVHPDLIDHKCNRCQNEFSDMKKFVDHLINYNCLCKVDNVTSVYDYLKYSYKSAKSLKLLMMRGFHERLGADSPVSIMGHELWKTFFNEY